jgi:hypothetical protein
LRAPAVIAGRFCHCGPLFVIADLIRNPVAAWHWIADVETPDLIRGRDDKPQARDDETRCLNFGISLS